MPARRSESTRTDVVENGGFARDNEPHERLGKNGLPETSTESSTRRTGRHAKTSAMEGDLTMRRFLGIGVGILVQVLFAVTSYYNYVFLRGTAPRPGHWALAWDGLLAIQFAVVHSVLLLPGSAQEAGAIHFAGLLWTVLLHGRLRDAAAHHDAMASRRLGHLAAHRLAEARGPGFVSVLLGNVVLQPVLLGLRLSHGISSLVVLGSAAADSAPPLPATRRFHGDPASRLHELSWA